MTTRAGVTTSPATTDAASTDEALEAELRTLRRLNERLVEELRAAEAVRDEYIDLYELAPIPALTLDAAYVTRRMNRAMNELLGVTRDQCLGESFRSFVFAEDRKLLSEHLARVPYEPAARCCLRLVPSSGAPIPVELWTNALARTGLFQLRVVDLREERLSDLEASRLVASERSARSANAAKDTFIAMLSHELRTPLTPALALASHFRDSHPSRDVRRAFGIVERNLLAEVRMIDDLLDVNRVVRGKMAVNCRPAAVHDIVREAAQPLLPAAQSKYQIVEFELRAEREHANVDGLRLRQVFGNLIRNASKFSPEGGEIFVRSWNNGSLLVVEVEDNGIGIAPEEIHRLFVPFDQLASRPGTSGGLGLGLAISRGLLDLQGGRLSVHSGGLGSGSRFVVELETVDPPDAGRVTPSAVANEPPTWAPRGARVLLIEDDPDSAMVLAEMLNLSGFQVQTAASVQAAREVDLKQIDLIVSDIGLPDGNGLSLIRELQSGGHRPAVALTGFGRESDVMAAIDAGFDAHLTKPIDIHLLVDMLAKMSQTGRV